MENNTIVLIIFTIVVIVALYVSYESGHFTVDWFGIITAIVLSAGLVLLYFRGYECGKAKGQEDGIKATTTWLKERMAEKEELVLDTLVIDTVKENIDSLLTKYDRGETEEEEDEDSDAY